MINIAGEELKCLKDELDEVSLEERQGDKDMQSQWIQTKMMIEPVINSNEEALNRKIDGQKHENQNLLKQLIELKKQYSVLRSQISMCNAKVKELRGQVG